MATDSDTFFLLFDFFFATGKPINWASNAVFSPIWCHTLSTPVVRQVSRIAFSAAVKSSVHSPRFNCLLINKTANLYAAVSELSEVISSLLGNQSNEDLPAEPRPLRRIILFGRDVLLSSSSPGTSTSSKAIVRMLRQLLSMICQSGDLATLALRCCLGILCLKAISKHFAMCPSCI